MPDVTPAQIIAVAGAALGVLAAFGLHLTKDQQDSILQLVTILSPVIIAADTTLRLSRARLVARIGGAS